MSVFHAQDLLNVWFQFRTQELNKVSLHLLDIPKIHFFIELMEWKVDKLVEFVLVIEYLLNSHLVQLEPRVFFEHVQKVVKCNKMVVELAFLQEIHN